MCGPGLTRGLTCDSSFPIINARSGLAAGVMQVAVSGRLPLFALKKTS